MRKIATAAILILLAALLGQACRRGGEGGRDEASRALTIKGSDTMVHLVTAWAESYMNRHPESQVSVTGGGSGTGIAAMINGTTDLCMASREVKPKEEELAAKQGISFEETIVARDGIAVVVHPQNPLDDLTMDQLRQIFNGTLDNWSQLGGPDEAIQALSRESNSGTYVFFNEHVLQKDDYGPAIRLMPSNAAIVQSVSQDAWSIGYVGLGYAQAAPVKIIQVKQDPEAPPVGPSIETVGDGSYPIARPLYVYSNGKPSGSAGAFLEFALSQEGQQIVQEAGYIPLG